MSLFILGAATVSADPPVLPLGLCEVLRETQQRTGATYLLTTHDMAAARRLADRLAVIHRGRIVASGPATEVLASDQPVARQLVSGAAAGPIRLRDP